MTQKTIITYGTFDMFHIGHLKLLQWLKGLGREIKGKKYLFCMNNIKRWFRKYNKMYLYQIIIIKVNSQNKKVLM